jgi:YfiH family protein
VRVRFTGRAEGDLGHGGLWVAVGDVDPGVHARRRAVVDAPWSWARQVHGAGILRVEGPGDSAGAIGDALVTAHSASVLAVLTADCAPVALAGDNGAFGVVHAGWRGLAAGVVRAAVGALRELGASQVEAALGPCIHACCCAFGAADLDRVAARTGDIVRSATRGGQPALDLPAGVGAALATAGAELVYDEGVCTACTPAYFSYRARKDTARQACVVWRQPTGEAGDRRAPGLRPGRQRR